MLSQETINQLKERIALASTVRGAARLTYRALQVGVPQSEVQPIARERKVTLKRANQIKRGETHHRREIG